MHVAHDGSVRVAQRSNHMLHEKSFWEIVAVWGLIALLFTLLVLFGENTFLQEYSVPAPYETY